ncbi:MAG: DUF3313 domain-containing protein [Dissulfurispiraceae bacterium]
MKTMSKAIGSLVIGLVLIVVTGCASTPKQTGFLGDYYTNLEPGPPDGVKMRWLKPGVDFSQYDKVMIDSVIFYFANDSEDKGIDTEDMKELTDSFDQAIVDALKDKYPIVADPGPGVVRIRVAITKLKKSKPALSAVSSVLPVGLGINIIKKGSTGSWTGSGLTDMEMMGLDSVSNEVIAVAEDEQSAKFTERFSSLGSAKEAFKFWAGRLRAFMDQVHGVNQ